MVCYKQSRERSGCERATNVNSHYSEAFDNLGGAGKAISKRTSRFQTNTKKGTSGAKSGTVKSNKFNYQVGKIQGSGNIRNGIHQGDDTVTAAKNRG